MVFFFILGYDATKITIFAPQLSTTNINLRGMKKELLFSLMLMAACIMPSCKKEPNGNNGSGGNIGPRPRTIVFGDYEGMNVVKYDKSDLKYDSTAPLHHDGLNAWYYEADLNQDGIGDITLRTLAYYYPLQDYIINFGVPFFQTPLSVTCHIGSQYGRALYSHCDTTVRVENDTTIIEYSIFETCQKMAETDSLIYDSYPYQNWEEHDRGDVFIKEYDPSYFQDIYVRLFDTHVYEFFPDSDETIINDTVFRKLYYLDYECSNIPLGIEKYIGFMASEYREAPKYGWLKFIIEIDENGQIMGHLLETAIEK